MGTLGRATETLRAAEAALQAFVAEAATQGDYGAVVQLAAWARAVNRMVGEVATRSSSIATTDSHSKPKGAVSTRIHRRDRSSAAGEYPRFFQNDGRVVRAAWSKRERKEYYHKASFSVIQHLAKKVLAIGEDGKVFSSDELFPLDDSDGTPIPTYQGYVGLALFKQAGLIDQHGRRGYSVVRLTNFIADVTELLSNLPKR